MFEFKKATRHKAKLRLALCAPSGGGKTYSALLIAKGMGGRVCVIDTENGSAELYAGLMDYDSGTIKPPFSPEKYIEAIRTAERLGYDTIIIDSLTHAWAAEGGILSEVDKRKGSGNDFAAWRHVTPMHNALVDAMLQSKCHIIATMRTKTEYALEKDDRGKNVPVKKGMAPIQRDGLEYEFTVVFDIEDVKKHMATAGKDRTSLFDGKYFVPSEETGRQLMEWLNSGEDAPEPAKEQARAMTAAEAFTAPPGMDEMPDSAQQPPAKPKPKIDIAGLAEFLHQLDSLDKLEAEYKLVSTDPRWPDSDQKAINRIFNTRKLDIQKGKAA